MGCTTIKSFFVQKGSQISHECFAVELVQGLEVDEVAEVAAGVTRLARFHLHAGSGTNVMTF
jgi:hypothetical protein